MAYMIEPIANAYGTELMRLASSMLLAKGYTLLHTNKTLLELFVLNLVRTLLIGTLRPSIVIPQVHGVA